MNLLRQIPSSLIWLAGLLASLIGILGVFNPACAVIAGVLTAIIITIQFVTQGNTTIRFQVGDWKKIGSSYEFSTGGRHGKGRKPNVTVYIPTSSGGFEKIECDIETRQSGEIFIGATRPFEGEVRIS